MGEIIKSKNGTIISPYKKHQCRTLENVTSIYDKVYHKRNEITGFYVDNYNGLPAFITHNQSPEMLTFNFGDYLIRNMRTTRSKKQSQFFKLNEDIVLRDMQGEISESILLDDYYKEFFVNAQTGSGKTVLGVYITSVLQCKTMILCFSTEILNQWKSTFINKTNKDPDKIMIISSSEILDKVYEEPETYDDYDIYLSTPGIITSYLKRTDYSRLERIMNGFGIGLLIFDESHRNMSNIVKINALSNVDKTIYMSADYAQGDRKKEKLYYQIFNKCKIITPSEDVSKTMKYTKIINITYDSHPSTAESMAIYNRYGYSADNYMRYQIRKGIIFKVLDFIMSAIQDEHRALILVTQIAHVDEITMYLKGVWKDKFTFGRYHSKVPAEEKEFAKNEANVIVSTYKSFSTGIDVDDIRYVVGLNQSNKVEDNQAAGRSRPLKDGKDAIYFIVTDNGFPYCKKKLKQRLKYLNKTKIKDCFVVDFDSV